MTDYADLEGVKSRLAGDNPSLAMSDYFDDVISAKITEVSADIDRLVAKGRGITGPWSFVADNAATERLYVARGGLYLPIDDCIEVTAVRELNPATRDTQYALVTNDYLTEPVQGTPIVGIRRTLAQFGRGVLVGVSAKWGFATTFGSDVREACIIEVIRSYLADRAGNDDRLGLTPFGSVITAKAYTSKVMQLVSDYSYGGGSLRG